MWKNPIVFGANRTSKNDSRRPFYVKIYKKLKLARNAIKGHFVIQIKKKLKLSIGEKCNQIDFRSSNIKGTFNYHINASKSKTVAICLG